MGRRSTQMRISSISRPPLSRKAYLSQPILKLLEVETATNTPPEDFYVPCFAVAFLFPVAVTRHYLRLYYDVSEHAGERSKPLVVRRHFSPC
jgi:hypothetical protein